ncbi:hypothetical protein QQZ08_011007 [Neonectria magnoliae]|uniref:Uncharacterized protein n=1 Tax=Neonectria magnoliae TaxID=2732573 RepID=A0ABR1HE24_9HYPO
MALSFFTLIKSISRATYRRRTLSAKVTKLSQYLTSIYQDNQISWMDYDDWMEELQIAADEGDLNEIRKLENRLEQIAQISMLKNA